MKTSSNGLRLITSAEGFKDSPYLDTSHIYTVGWGHALKTPAGQNIDVDVFGAQKALELTHTAMQTKYGTQIITQEQADQTLSEDLAGFEVSMLKKLPGDTTQNQFDALMSFAYNVGPGNYDSSSVKTLHNAGKRTVGNLSLIDTCQLSKEKANPTTIAIAFSRWSNSGGEWTLGLFRRRMAEVLVYSGWDGVKAVSSAWAFHD